MIYNGYQLNYSIKELENMIQNQTEDITLVSKQSPCYLSLSEENKKVLSHLTKAAKILNNVALAQDNSQNISLKQELEKHAAYDKQAELSLKMFNSINGVSGLNGIDEQPITIFKNLTTPAGKNFYPEDLSTEEFHQILLKMFKNNEIEEIKNEKMTL